MECAMCASRHMVLTTLRAEPRLIKGDCRWMLCAWCLEDINTYIHATGVGARGRWGEDA